ncbi:MAG: hypothetical protein CMC04_07680 [Flavobacteriaceae bacterium]|nr:hypothetical protein [Flavobacteriaceae bacterium]|tara:strand:+ start:20027 stop:20956 length:930 start_codon:yes stop_codon:yes gene_type:complete
MERQISILMPVFNGEDYLHQSISSILNQTFKDFEFIIINDGSTDNSHEIISSFKDPRIKYHSTKNNGLISALNFGLSLCSGDWIARFDCDDIAFPNRIKHQIDNIDKNTVLIGSSVDVIDHNNIVLKNNISVPIKHEEIINNLLLGKTSIFHPSVMIKKSAIKKIGGYNKLYKHSEDLELWLSISKLGEMKNLSKSLIRLRKHSSNISFLNIEEQMINGVIARYSFIKKIKLTKVDFIKLQKFINSQNSFQKALKSRIKRELIKNEFYKKKFPRNYIYIFKNINNLFLAVFSNYLWKKLLNQILHNYEK